MSGIYYEILNGRHYCHLTDMIDICLNNNLDSNTICWFYSCYLSFEWSKLLFVIANTICIQNICNINAKNVYLFCCENYKNKYFIIYYHFMKSLYTPIKCSHLQFCILMFPNYASSNHLKLHFLWVLHFEHVIWFSKITYIL